jgi:hypothetical protein
MPTYKIYNTLETIIEAEDEDEAMVKCEEELVNANECLENYSAIVEVCPECEIELEPKMIDIDGTNLVEHNICPKCGYGTPALL